VSVTLLPQRLGQQVSPKGLYFIFLFDRASLKYVKNIDDQLDATVTIY
jgi:hypothetical protein